MRPQKITTEKLTDIINGINQQCPGLMYTDEELVNRINKCLPKDERISYRTYQRYKAAALAHGEMELEEEGKFDPVFASLSEAIMDNTIDQKQTLFTKMMEAEGSIWMRYRWIMERKFPDYNLRHQGEMFIQKSKLEMEQFRNDYMEAKGQPSATETSKEKTEKAAAEAPKEKYPIRIMSGDVDWTEYHMQQTRKMLAEHAGEPFTEELIPPPAPFVKFHSEIEREEREMANEGKEMSDDKSQISDRKLRVEHGEPDDDADFGGDDNEPNNGYEEPSPINPIELMDDEQYMREVYSTDPWIKPDGTKRTTPEYFQYLKHRRAPSFGNHKPKEEQPKPMPRSYPPGTKKILGLK